MINPKCLAPVIPSPWSPYRSYVAEQMKDLGVKPGDIVCRLGNAYLFGFFWLSKFIAKVTHSRYSHAAIITDVEDDIIIVDVSSTSTRRQFAQEWADDVWGQDILIVRYTGDPVVPMAAVDNVKHIESKSLSYSDTFNEEGKFYCTELICWAYVRAGVSLCEEIPIREFPGWRWHNNILAWMNGVDPKTPVWCVGNERVGILSSKQLTKVGRIILPSVRRHNVKHAFAGV